MHRLFPDRDERFPLLPFFPLQAPEVCITGRVFCHAPRLQVHFSITGALATIALPEQAPESHRCHNLWRQTCFETFFSPGTQPGYWEINLSPSGDWNCYRFTDYRQGMAEEPAVTGLAAELLHLPDRLDCSVQIDLVPLGLAETPLAIGLACVIRDRAGRISHWAPAHPAEKPDFHHRAGWFAASRPSGGIGKDSV